MSARFFHGNFLFYHWELEEHIFIVRIVIVIRIFIFFLFCSAKKLHTKKFGIYRWKYHMCMLEIRRKARLHWKTPSTTCTLSNILSDFFLLSGQRMGNNILIPIQWRWWKTERQFPWKWQIYYSILTRQQTMKVNRDCQKRSSPLEQYSILKSSFSRKKLSRWNLKSH